MDRIGFINASNYTTESTDSDLIYMVKTMWDEWAAYTTTCNYYDSIAGDIFEQNNLTVAGTEEKEAIRQHLIDTGYDKYDENDNWVQCPTPDYKNWDWDTFNNMFYFA